MAAKRIDSFEEERFVRLLQNAVEKVKTEEDPLLLSEYKKLFKKHVPFTLRGYVSAYLAKSFSSSSRNNRFGRKNERFEKGRKNSCEKTFTKRERAPKSEVTNASTRVVIDAEKSATIFVSVGRNRGVYPRDLVGLIANTADIERERIGDIRVLDNYSFVQVYSEDSEKIIAAVNGTEYRNRKLTVSYSRKKEEKPAESASCRTTASTASGMLV